MLGSTNHYFTQSALKLQIGRVNVIDLLTIKGYNAMSIEVYLKAFDYFTVNPSDFDGATLVTDLCDLPDLELSAMLHDYQYLVYNVGASIELKTKADYLYSRNVIKNKPLLKNKWLKFLGYKYLGDSRFVGLTVISLGFIPFSRLKRGKVTAEQRENFLRDFKTLT